MNNPLFTQNTLVAAGLCIALSACISDSSSENQDQNGNQNVDSMPQPIAFSQSNQLTEDNYERIAFGEFELRGEKLYLPLNRLNEVERSNPDYRYPIIRNHSCLKDIEGSKVAYSEEVFVIGPDYLPDSDFAHAASVMQKASRNAYSYMYQYKETDHIVRQAEYSNLKANARAVLNPEIIIPLLEAYMPVYLDPELETYVDPSRPHLFDLDIIFDMLGYTGEWDHDPTSLKKVPHDVLMRDFNKALVKLNYGGVWQGRQLRSYLYQHKDAFGLTDELLESQDPKYPDTESTLHRLLVVCLDDQLIGEQEFGYDTVFGAVMPPKSVWQADNELMHAQQLFYRHWLESASSPVVVPEEPLPYWYKQGMAQYLTGAPIADTLNSRALKVEKEEDLFLHYSSEEEANAEFARAAEFMIKKVMLSLPNLLMHYMSENIKTLEEYAAEGEHDMNGAYRFWAEIEERYDLTKQDVLDKMN